jgi:hypothetical protein
MLIQRQSPRPEGAARAAGALMAERPVSRTAAVVIVFVWIASIEGELTGVCSGGLEAVDIGTT